MQCKCDLRIYSNYRNFNDNIILCLIRFMVNICELAYVSLYATFVLSLVRRTFLKLRSIKVDPNVIDYNIHHKFTMEKFSVSISFLVFGIWSLLRFHHVLTADIL